MEPYPPAAAASCDTPAAPAPDHSADPRVAFARSKALQEEMATRLGSAELLSATYDRVEDYLIATGRELQRQLLQDHLDLRAAAEERLPAVTGSDNLARGRAEKGRRRQLATTVGRVEVSRLAYRAPKAGALHPADAHLALPAAPYSHPLRRQVVHAAATGSLRTAREALIRSTGQHLGTRQLMEICTCAAAEPRWMDRPRFSRRGPTWSPWMSNTRVCACMRRPVIIRCRSSSSFTGVGSWRARSADSIRCAAPSPRSLSGARDG
ncbi:hypothetical protein [Streptomyces sp900129855]|uniref:DUF222 domain-containing protein n=1 Tax=Streptomyces sp. 900129855 TaxID=3155129 RepID=A0ABV2ZZB8_9ACTN